MSVSSSSLALFGGSPVRVNKPFPRWPQHDTSEREALLRALDSGKWGVGGAETTQFEQSFAQYQHCSHCITMVNGSTSLRNALLACDLRPGAEVIMPPYTFLATAVSVLEANCTPVFADIDPDTYCLDPQALEAAITPHTGAIMPVHLGGMPAAMDAIMAIAKRHNLRVIEDCAQAHGAELQGRRVGSWGDLGCFSFQSSKNLCCGEGGAIVTNDDALADKCWSIHNCGRQRGGISYVHGHLGGNSRLSQFNAAILNAQLAKLDQRNSIRQHNAAYLNQHLAQIPGIRPLQPSSAEYRSGCHLYVFRYDSDTFAGVPRQKFLEALAAEGVYASVGYATLVYQHQFMINKQFWTFDGWRQSRPNLDYTKDHCPVAEKASSSEGCWLTQNVLLGTEEDMRDIVDAISKVYENRQQLSQGK